MADETTPGEDASGGDTPHGGTPAGSAGAASGPVADALAQTGLLTLGQSPSYGMAMQMLQAGNASGVLFANMVHAQQQSHVAGQAATVEAVIRTYGRGR
jgi:hypothetical protein